MSFKIRLNNISVPTGHRFKVFYKLNSRTPGNVTSQSDTEWGTYYGTYTGGTTTDIEIDFDLIDPSPFGKQYWFKILDIVTGSYIIENIYVHEYEYYYFCDHCCDFSGGTATFFESCDFYGGTATYYIPPTVTPTPTATNTPTPTVTITNTPTATNTPTPTVTNTPTPTATNTPTPTITEIPLNRYVLVGPYGTISEACVAGNTTGAVLGLHTVTDDNIVIGSIVYNNPFFETPSPVSGAPGWYAIGGSFIGVYSAIRLDNTGTIVELGGFCFF